MDLNPKYDDYYFPVKAAEEQTGHAGYLTEGQIAQVHQLRMMLEAEGFTDRLDTLTLLRFLRARKWVVEDSKKMFVDTEAWRKEINLDGILPTWDYPEKAEISKYYTQYYHKTDKDGRPVYIEAFGKINLSAMYKITTQERMLTNLAVEYEKVADPRLPACSHKAGTLQETCCTVMDVKGVSITSLSSVYTYVSKASVISQNYYPERLGKLYLVNAPWGFETAFNMFKGLLDPVTAAKISIVSKGSTPSELLKQIPAENLPKEFGGTCECEGGCENSDAGPWHDPEHTRTPQWAKKDDGKTIENKGSEIETPAGEKAPAAVPATDADAATQPAAA